MSDLKVNVIDHPLIQHKLTLMRQKDTGTKDFRELLEEISMFMAYEITRDFPLKEVDIETPVAKCKSKVLAGKKVGVVPILRAGLGMLSGVVNMIPAARVGHVGMYRDPETLKPVEYYCKLPSDVADRTLIVVDPMLATGGSASAALSLLKEKGTALVAGTALSLTRKEYDLLYMFLSNQGRIFSRDELLDRLWGYDYTGDTRTVDTHMRRLRAKLEKAGVQGASLATVWGRGYRLEESHAD